MKYVYMYALNVICRSCKSHTQQANIHQAQHKYIMTVAHTIFLTPYLPPFVSANAYW